MSEHHWTSSDINGEIMGSRSGAGEITFSHEGGRIIGISIELLEDADPRFIKRDDVALTIGPFCARILAEDERGLICELAVWA